MQPQSCQVGELPYAGLDAQDPVECQIQDLDLAQIRNGAAEHCR